MYLNEINYIIDEKLIYTPTKYIMKIREQDNSHYCNFEFVFKLTV